MLQVRNFLVNVGCSFAHLIALQIAYTINKDLLLVQEPDLLNGELLVTILFLNASLHSNTGLLDLKSQCQDFLILYNIYLEIYQIVVLYDFSLAF